MDDSCVHLQMVVRYDRSSVATVVAICCSSDMWEMVKSDTKGRKVKTVLVSDMSACKICKFRRKP